MVRFLYILWKPYWLFMLTFFHIWAQHFYIEQISQFKYTDVKMITLLGHKMIHLILRDKSHILQQFCNLKNCWSKFGIKLYSKVEPRSDWQI